jgi:divalent anion:Na+ symporter, DASS family
MKNTAQKSTKTMPLVHKRGASGAKLIPSLATLFLGGVLWMIPCPEGLDPRAWQLFAIFVATIFGIIAKPLPLGAIAVVSLGVCILTQTLGYKEALSGFGSDVVWLVMCAFLIARGLIKTGLAQRIAYIFVRFFGKSSIGLSYSLLGADLILAPAIPSSTARGGGILFPIVKALAESQGSSPADHTERKLGSFLMQTVFHGNTITCAMFVTAFAGNPLIVEMASKVGIDITWAGWAKAAIIPGLMSLALLPWVMYLFYPPKIKHTPQAPLMALKKLDEMGKMSHPEKIMGLTFLSLLVLWIFGREIGVDAMPAALFGLVTLIITGVLDWQDILEEKTAWDTFIWFGILLMMAGMLTKLGMIHWFSLQIKDHVSGFHWGWALGVLSLIYFFCHYFFASATAHVSAMYAAFLGVLLTCGTPPMLGALVLAYFSSLCGGLTHYGMGTSPVYFGAGYVTIGDWWRLGAIVGVFHLLVWGIIGGAWWRFLGIF